MTTAPCVGCDTPVELTAIPAGDGRTVLWRPKPPLCEACKAKGEQDAAAWAALAHPVCHDCGMAMRTPAERVRFVVPGAEDLPLCYECASRRVAALKAPA